MKVADRRGSLSRSFWDRTGKSYCRDQIIPILTLPLFLPIIDPAASAIRLGNRSTGTLSFMPSLM